MAAKLRVRSPCTSPTGMTQQTLSKAGTIWLGEGAQRAALALAQARALGLGHLFEARLHRIEPFDELLQLV